MKTFAARKTRAAERALVESLAQTIPPLEAVLSESRADNDGELLPHLVMADYERWLEDAITSEGTDAEYARQLLRELETAVTNNALVDNIIGVSFVEMLPLFPPTPAGKRIYAELGSTMRAMANSIFLRQFDTSKVARWVPLVEALALRPGMYVGVPTYARITSYLDGFNAGLEDNLLQEFGRWLLDTSPKPHCGCDHELVWSACALLEIFPDRADTESLTPSQDAEAIDYVLRRLREFLAACQT